MPRVHLLRASCRLRRTLCDLEDRGHLALLDAADARINLAGAAPRGGWPAQQPPSRHGGTGPRCRTSTWRHGGFSCVGVLAASGPTPPGARGEAGQQGFGRTDGTEAPKIIHWPHGSYLELRRDDALGSEDVVMAASLADSCRRERVGDALAYTSPHRDAALDYLTPRGAVPTLQRPKRPLQPGVSTLGRAPISSRAPAGGGSGTTPPNPLPSAPGTLARLCIRVCLGRTIGSSRLLGLTDSV